MVRKWLGVIAILASVIISYEVYSSSKTVEVSTLNVEEKWQETGLAAKDIENLFVNKHCHVNKKYFLACMNALSVLAERQGELLTAEGKILKNIEKKSITEKERVQLWENVWEDNKSTQIPIETLWKNLSDEIIASPLESMRVAQTFNAYLSVYKDPHTYILPKEYYEKVVAQSQNKISSYGFIVAKINNRFVFTRVFPDSIFEKSGVKKGDVLLEVDGVEVSNLSHDELLQLFKGKAKNDFMIMQKEKLIELSMSKENQILKSVHFKKLETTAQNKFQYQLSIYKIAEGVCKETEAYLRKANAQKASGVILDLRDNSGGSMDEVLCLAGLFVGEKKIYELKYFNQKNGEDFVSASEQVYFGPLAVLINQNTASSAEILAGVLQDYKRASIVGERSFGKGSFQEGEVWFKNSKILIFQTKGLFNLPSGISPQLMGILPDVPIDSVDVAEGREEDLYFSPVKAAFDLEKYSRNQPKHSQKKDSCEELSSPNLTEDPQLGKAQIHLSCS